MQSRNIDVRAAGVEQTEIPVLAESRHCGLQLGPIDLLAPRGLVGLHAHRVPQMPVGLADDDRATLAQPRPLAARPALLQRIA